MEPAHKERDILVFQFVVFQMCMKVPYLGYRYAFVAQSFLNVSTTCLQTSNALARLCLCTALSESFAGQLCDKYPFLVCCLI